jgi:hypothetical protein
MAWSSVGGVIGLLVLIGAGSFERGGGDTELALALEGGLARHHLVQHCAQRNNVAATIQVFPLDLVRRHILRRQAIVPSCVTG